MDNGYPLGLAPSARQRFLFPRALGKTVTPLYRVQSERSLQVVNE